MNAHSYTSQFSSDYDDSPTKPAYRTTFKPSMARKSREIEEPEDDTSAPIRTKKKAGKFLKRGQGKLCTKGNEVSEAKIPKRATWRSPDRPIRQASLSKYEEELDPEAKMQFDLKLQQLDGEIDKLKLENEQVKKIKNELTRENKQLDNKIIKFHNERDKELQELRVMKEKEVKDAAKEARSMNRNMKSQSSEVENLKKQLEKLMKEESKKEQKQLAQVDQLKEQVQGLIQHNINLR